MIKVVTDSTCYLPPGLIVEHDIRVVPLSVLFGNQAYREGFDMDAEGFFRRMEQENTFPTTSQPGIEDFLGVWRPLLDAGHKIITILISGGLSGTVATARSAARSLPDRSAVTVFDSTSTAMGLGMQALRAAELAEEGHSVSDILSVLERMREAIRVLFMIDTLEYLRRGGRINAASAWLGTLLRVKPLLALHDGVIVPLEQVRTARRAVARLRDLAIAHLKDDRQPWIAVMHSRSPEAGHKLLDALRPYFPDARFFFSEIGPVLGTHLGPGGVGLMICPGAALGLSSTNGM